MNLFAVLFRRLGVGAFALFTGLGRASMGRKVPYRNNYSILDAGSTI